MQKTFFKIFFLVWKAEVVKKKRGNDVIVEQKEQEM